MTTKNLVGRRKLAEARALCSATAVEASCAQSMRPKATRLAEADKRGWAVNNVAVVHSRRHRRADRRLRARKRNRRAVRRAERHPIWNDVERMDILQRPAHRRCAAGRHLSCRGS